MAKSMVMKSKVVMRSKLGQIVSLEGPDGCRQDDMREGPDWCMQDDCTIT
jgi:hypothetical protein